MLFVSCLAFDVTLKVFHSVLILNQIIFHDLFPNLFSHSFHTPISSGFPFFETIVLLLKYLFWVISYYGCNLCNLSTAWRQGVKLLLLIFWNLYLNFLWLFVLNFSSGYPFDIFSEFVSDVTSTFSSQITSFILRYF